jgi:hypothetical protein
MNWPEWRIRLAQCGYASPIFVFQESGHAFVDVNGSFMLSPDEGTWQDLKQVELRNVCCFDLNHLHQQLDLAILRLRHKPYLIRSFFDRAGLYL